MHIELTEMLRCPQLHREEFLVLSTGAMSGRMVRHGIVGCPVCQREYEIVDGVVHFVGAGSREPGAGAVAERPAPSSLLPAPDALQALLDLSSPGGFVILLGSAARAGAGLAQLLDGIHCVGVNAPDDMVELPVLSLLRCEVGVPLRASVARGVAVGGELASSAWLADAARVLLRGRRLVVAGANPAPPGVKHLVTGQGLWVGEKQ
jgi:uncharacterized protein YbaR (Trm112 family)